MSTKPCRRTWSAEEKRRIIDETRSPGASVSSVARHHDVNANLLFKWLRQAGEGRGKSVKPASGGDDHGDFITLGVVSADADTDGALTRGAAAYRPSGPALPPTASKLEERVGTIEIDLTNGTRVRVDGSVDQRALRRVLQAMKGIT